MAQADQRQRKAELVGFPAALGDERQIFGAECRVADHLALVRGKANQPCLRRLAQQPSSCHRALPSAARGSSSPVRQSTL